MLDPKFIRENSDIVRKSLKDRGITLDLDELLSLDGERRKLITKVETHKNERNIESEKIGKLLREKKEIR